MYPARRSFHHLQVLLIQSSPSDLQVSTSEQLLPRLLLPTTKVHASSAIRTLRKSSHKVFIMSIRLLSIYMCPLRFGLIFPLASLANNLLFWKARGRRMKGPHIIHKVG